jgi:hypothetical protein
MCERCERYKYTIQFKGYMRKIEIFDEEDQILIEDEFRIDTYTIHLDKKWVSLSSSVKDDVFYNKLVWEYKLSTDPIKLQMRLIEKSFEPPEEYQVRDGVVLESEMQKEGGILAHRVEENIAGLKKMVEWEEIDLTNGNFAVNFWILSKHPDIIPADTYRKLVRQNIERIKSGVAKTENRIKTDRPDLEVKSYDSGRGLDFVKNEQIKKEESAWKDNLISLGKEKKDGSIEGKQYQKRLDDLTDYTKSLFSKDSKNYIGISEYEFGSSEEIIAHLERSLGGPQLKNSAVPQAPSAWKSIITSILLTLFLSWVVSLFVDINPVLIFILVQVIAFLQRMIGDWIQSKWFG